MLLGVLVSQAPCVLRRVERYRGIFYGTPSFVGIQAVDGTLKTLTTPALIVPQALNFLAGVAFAYALRFCSISIAGPLANGAYRREVYVSVWRAGGKSVWLVSKVPARCSANGNINRACATIHLLFTLATFPRQG